MTTLPTPPTPDNIEDQLALYFDNQATPQIVQAIQDWLEEDSANAEIFAEYGYIERMIFCAQKKEDASAVFAMLAEMEDAAETEVITLVGELPQQHNDPGSLSAHDLAIVGGYILRKALTRKSAIFSGIAAVAAILLIALILISPFASDEPAPIADQDFWDDTETSQPETPAPLPAAVAMLTASNDARWDTPAGTLAPNTGDALRPGNRLTLTAGFAEITTNDGAVAILEAPCSIELIDSPNALRLHTGKLVGICETESSKGFLVRTPSIDITDLGTRFGVAVDQTNESIVHVFEGSVTTKPAASHGRAAPAEILVAGDSQAFDHSGKEVDAQAPVSTTFARLACRVGGVTKLSGKVDWVEPATYLEADMSTWPKQAHAVVMPEQRDFTLKVPLELSIAAKKGNEQYKTVKPGTTIRTYIVLFNPGGPNPSVAEGEVTFEGEILGIVIYDKWQLSLGVLQDNPEVKLFDIDQRASSIELTDFDVIDFSPDGHTLAFKLQAGLACDTMRIVVREPIRDPN